MIEEKRHIGYQLPAFSGCICIIQPKTKVFCKLFDISITEVILTATAKMAHYEMPSHPKRAF